VTRVLPPTEDGVATAAEILGGGGLVAFPTDTVYGVACARQRIDRVAALFDLKRRPPDKQIPLLVRALGEIGPYRVTEAARALAVRYWPGPLTLVLAAVGAAEPGTQAFRAPNHVVALDLIGAAGPLFATSANVSGEPEALSADDVLIAFATQQDALDAVVDGGQVPGGMASTVLDLTVAPARLLREGPVTRSELAALIALE
jgi:L-threonylcarbamoyladenylate synthase